MVSPEEESQYRPWDKGEGLGSLKVIARGGGVGIQNRHCRREMMSTS